MEDREDREIIYCDSCGYPMKETEINTLFNSFKCNRCGNCYTSQDTDCSLLEQKGKQLHLRNLQRELGVWQKILPSQRQKKLAEENIERLKKEIRQLETKEGVTNPLASTIR